MALRVQGLFGDGTRLVRRGFREPPRGKAPGSRPGSLSPEAGSGARTEGRVRLALQSLPVISGSCKCDIPPAVTERPRAAPGRSVPAAFAPGPTSPSARRSARRGRRVPRNARPAPRFGVLSTPRRPAPRLPGVRPRHPSSRHGPHAARRLVRGRSRFDLADVGSACPTSCRPGMADTTSGGRGTPVRDGPVRARVRLPFPGT